MKTSPPSPLLESRLILAFTLIGGVVRSWRFASIGLEHFDEGIYVMVAQQILTPPRGGPWIDSTLVVYAPPIYPMLITVVHAVLGVSDRSAIFVSWLAGTMTIPLVGSIGRRWIGPGAGAAAAALAALSGAHVVFSRMGLTDATHLLAWLAALALGARFLERPTAFRSLAFGVAVGVAQLVKYSGWVAGLVVALAALAGTFVGDPGARSLSRRALWMGLLAAGAAALTYAPWFEFVETHGGYARLMEHHGGYVDGPRFWAENWRQQMAQTVALSGRAWEFLPWDCVAWGLAWGGMFLVRGRGFTPDVRSVGTVAMLIAVAAVAPEFPWWIGLVALPTLARSPVAGHRVLAASWLLMTLLTPLYHPYARLWLPLHAAGWLLGAYAIAGGHLVPAPGGRPSPKLLLAMGLAVAGHFALYPGATPLPDLLRPTDGLRAATRQLDEGPMARGPLGKRPRLSAYIRPPSRFYLVQRRIDFDRLSRFESIALERPLVHYVLIDEVQAPGWLPPDLGAPDGTTIFATIRPGPASLLDLDPSAAFGRSPYQVHRPDGTEGYRLWLLKGGR